MGGLDNDKLEIPITKLQWSLRGSQIFFAFLGMATISAVLSFDNKHTSGKLLDAFACFIFIVSMFFSALIVGIPYAYLQYGKFKSAARALRLVRIEFVLSAIWAVFIFIVAVGLTIEFSLRKCSPGDFSADFLNATANKTGDHSFESGIKRTCTTGKSSAAFGWFALIAWGGSLLLIAKEWYDNRRQPVPKHEYHANEVTMHSNSTRSSLEGGLAEHGGGQFHEQAPTSNIPHQPVYSETGHNQPQGYIPPSAPSQIPPPIQQFPTAPSYNPSSIQIPNPQISFPEPKRF